MPSAGIDPRSRQYAHLKWAQRYNDAGEVDKAASHLGRALHYGEAANEANGKHQAGFGAKGTRGPQSSGAKGTRGPQGPARPAKSKRSSKRSAKSAKSRKSPTSAKSSDDEEEDQALDSWDEMRRKYRYFLCCSTGSLGYR
jgi:hypothetical protein